MWGGIAIILMFCWEWGIIVLCCFVIIFVCWHDVGYLRIVLIFGPVTLFYLHFLYKGLYMMIILIIFVFVFDIYLHFLKLYLFSIDNLYFFISCLAYLGNICTRYLYRCVVTESLWNPYACCYYYFIAICLSANLSINRVSVMFLILCYKKLVVFSMLIFVLIFLSPDPFVRKIVLYHFLHFRYWSLSSDLGLLFSCFRSPWISAL